MSTPAPLHRRAASAAAALGFVALLSTGCTTAPPVPSCVAFSDETSPASAICRLEHDRYQDYLDSRMARLRAGDRDTWISTLRMAIPPAVAISAGVIALALRSRVRPTAPPETPTPQPPPPPPPPLPSFVGTRIRYRGALCTVVEAGLPSLADARLRGGRTSVIALDAKGNRGVLFLRFDSAGTLFEAATDRNDWAPAVVVA